MARTTAHMVKQDNVVKPEKLPKQDKSAKKDKVIKPGVRVVPVDVFNRSVVVMIGDIPGCKALLAKDRKAGIPKDVREMVFAHLEEALEEHTRGLGLTFAVEGDVYIYLRKRDSAVCVHELYHAVQGIMQMCGMDDEETGAYLMGYLYENLMGM